MTLLLSINEVIESLADPPDLPAPCRVLWFDRQSDCIVLMAFLDDPKHPLSMRLSIVEQWLRSNLARLVPVQPPAYMLRGDNSEAARALRDKSWERIAPLVATETIFTAGAIGKMVAARAAELSVPRKSLYRLLYRYWMHGQVRDALLPNFEQRGGQGKAKQYSESKRAGPEPRYLGEVLDTPRQALTEADKACIKVGYGLYKRNEVKSVPDAYIKTLRRFYALDRKVVGASDDDVTLRPLHELPTLRQFTYWGKKAYDDLEVLRGRRGEHNWQKDHRALIGRAGDGVRGICHRFEIDATIADIYLVSRYNRNWIIGRPVVYVVVDVFSAMIVGLFVRLEGPSWSGARQALFNAYSDKAAYCAAYGLTISPEDWPCHHLPQEIMADRGEMLGKAAEESLVSGLGVTLAIAPPFRPDWKAIVESRFRLLNQTSQIHWIPGAVRERNRERGERDYRLDATLDLAEFTYIILSSVLHYNHHHRQPDRLTADMIASGVTNGTPVNIWNWSMAEGFSESRCPPVEAVYRHLLLSDTASIQAGGIYFKGMFYVCEPAEQEQWFARARKNGRHSIDLWYDANSTEHVWIRDAAGRFAPCKLRASESRYRERRIEEVIDMLAIVDTPSPETVYADLNSRVQLDATIEAKINHATAEKKEAAEPMSKAQQVANIRQNRARERDWIAPQSAPTLQPAPTPGPNESAIEYAGERSGEVINLLSRLRPGAKK